MNPTYRRWLPLLGPLLLLALWQLMISAHWVKPVLLPPPADTLAHLLGVFGSGAIFVDLWATLYRTLASFGIAVAIGVPLGVVLGSSEGAYRSVEFVIDFFRSTPSSALIPAVPADLRHHRHQQDRHRQLWRHADRAVQQRLWRDERQEDPGDGRADHGCEAAGMCFKDVMLMESLPQTFVGLRSAVSMALVIVIVAEMFIGSETGLGHRIIDAQQVFNVKEMYCSILVTGALGYLLNLGFLLIEKKLIHWSGKA